MKKYLINPNLNWYKANLHCHTTNSDGFYTPEQIKKIYKEHGYSVVAYTDHDVIFDNSHLTDDDFVALTAVEYSIYPRGNVRWRDMSLIHLNLFSKDPHNLFHPAAYKEMLNERQVELFKSKYNMDIPCDNYHREFTNESVQETIDRANKMGFLVQFNHPNWSLNARDDYINLKGLWALEIYNHLTELETGAEYCPYVYDDMLRHGHRLFCTMGDDNHNYQGSIEGSFGGFDYIGTTSLTYDNIFNALKEGCFYSSMGPTIKYLYYDSETKKIYLECSEAVNIIFVGCNRTFMHCLGENLTKAEFEIFDDEEYFRITVRDKYGKSAHTRAYFVDEFK